MWNWQKSLIGAGLSAALVPTVLSISATPTRAQPPAIAIEIAELHTLASEIRV